MIFIKQVEEYDVRRVLAASVPVKFDVNSNDQEDYIFASGRRRGILAA